MTTSEFIAMLKEQDPTGTAHVRLSGGVPYRAEGKPGYYDGPYEYINSEGKWVYSAKEDKVDIYCKDREDMIYETIDKWNPFLESEEGLWEKCKAMFVFELDCYSGSEQRQERVDSFFKPLKKQYDYWVNFRRESWNKHLAEVIELHKSGCRFFQKKDSKWKYYDGWKWINKNDSKKIGSANLAHTYPILQSGKFKQIQCTKLFMKDYWEYVLVD